MIKGTAHWNNRQAFYTQENNPTEQMLKKRLSEMGITKGWLETCGPTAALNCMSSMNPSGLENTTLGGFQIQPEEVLSDWFNDPRNYDKMRRLWSGLDPAKIPGNEVARWYPVAIKEVFDRKCEFVGALSFDQACQYLSVGNSIQSCLITPGHFIAIVAFDTENHDLIIKDSWQGRWPDGIGFCKRLSRDEFEKNTKPLNLVYL